MDGQAERNSDQRVGANLKEIRETRLMTQGDLAEQTRLDVTTIQRIETGSKPSKESLKAICAALDIDVAELRRGPSGSGSPSQTLPADVDLKVDQLVQLDTVRIAKYVADVFKGTDALELIPQPNLTQLQQTATHPMALLLRRAIEMRRQDFVGALTDGILLDFQDEMNNLRAVGLVLALGRATQELQIDPGPDGMFRDAWFPQRTVFATVLKAGTPRVVAVVPRRLDDSRRKRTN